MSMFFRFLDNWHKQLSRKLVNWRKRGNPVRKEVCQTQALLEASVTGLKSGHDYKI